MKTIVIPRTGKPSAARQQSERRRGFRRLVKWGTGSEGRISSLKRTYGWNRTLLDGIDGAGTWCGLGVLVHNARKISGLIEAKNPEDVPLGASPGVRGATDPSATRPPREPPPSLAAH